MLSKYKNNILVKNLMLPIGSFPCINNKTILKEALDKMTIFKLGICCITEKGKLIGILTDGDLRRRILEIQKPISSLLVDDAIVHAIRKPVSIGIQKNIRNAVKVMEKNLIWDLPVVDANNKLCGLLHLHKVIKKILAI